MRCVARYPEENCKQWDGSIGSSFYLGAWFKTIFPEGHVELRNGMLYVYETSTSKYHYSLQRGDYMVVDENAKVSLYSEGTFHRSYEVIDSKPRAPIGFINDIHNMEP